jgi:catechol 2,3-dioxygenase
MPIPPDTRPGTVGLTVRDADRLGDFYEHVVGFGAVERGGSTTRLGAEEGQALVELFDSPSAPPRPPRTTGLFHLAILVPSRLELARALRRVANAGWHLAGASDHLVSEALYLEDPEGNGIEVYRDRTRDHWVRDGDELRMATLPLDLHALIAELADEPDDALPGSLPAGTRMGHVHLNVGDLDAAEVFYAGLLGLEVTARAYPGALFLSAGGYHHHVGLNVWAGEGAPPPPEGSSGLRAFELTLPGEDDLDAVVGRLRDGETDVQAHGGGASVRDPAGNRVVLGARGQ